MEKGTDYWNKKKLNNTTFCPSQRQQRRMSSVYHIFALEATVRTCVAVLLHVLCLKSVLMTQHYCSEQHHTKLPKTVLLVECVSETLLIVCSLSFILKSPGSENRRRLFFSLFGALY